MSHPPVYLDHAATTPVRAEVLEAMLPYLGSAAFGNPSSSHRFGRTARAGIEEARRQVAAAVGAEPSQVIFTSGGTEADNLAVVGASLAAGAAGHPMHAAVCATDHKAVLAAAHAVTRLGGSETVLPVDSHGLLDLAALDAALATKPAVVSVMWVNNEVGTIQPVEEIGRRCRAAGAMFHTDAVQAFGQLPVSCDAADATLLTLSGHKIGAPKGVGALIVRSRAAVEAIIHGGSQQFGLRPGTDVTVQKVVGGQSVTSDTALPSTIVSSRSNRPGLTSTLSYVAPAGSTVSVALRSIVTMSEKRTWVKRRTSSATVSARVRARRQPLNRNAGVGRSAGVGGGRLMRPPPAGRPARWRRAATRAVPVPAGPRRSAARSGHRTVPPAGDNASRCARPRAAACAPR